MEISDLLRRLNKEYGKMKILMATMKMDIGGAETHILELSRALCQEGHEVTVVSNGGSYVKILEESGVKHVWAPLHTKKIGALLQSKKFSPG